MGLSGFLTGSLMGSKWAILCGDHVCATYVCLYGLELGSEWALSGFQLGNLYETHVGYTCVRPFRVPSGFALGFQAAPTCVIPYGLTWVFDWVLGGFQMGNSMWEPCVPHLCLPIWA